MLLDFKRAHKLCLLAQLAYADEGDIKIRLEKLGPVSYFRFFSNAESQAYIAKIGNEIFVSFRGTEMTNMGDWARNAKFNFVNSRIGRVHQGFAFALNAIWSPILTTIKDWRSDGDALWITGHSLGGALATIASDRLWDHKIPVSGIYTFGQPRVGDSVFADELSARYKGKFYRFVNNEDCVTRVPLGHQYFKHVGTCVYISALGDFYIDIHWLPKFIDRAVSKVKRYLLRENPSHNANDLKDHELNNYLNCIVKECS